MKQYESVVKVMKENGGYATLGFLNQNVLKIKGCEWKTLELYEICKVYCSKHDMKPEIL